MKFGVSLFTTDFAIPPHEAAKAAEDAGLESIWFPEHTHMPVETRFPMGDGQVPREYKCLMDPFIGLAAAAAVTKTIKLGTGICLIPQRDPLTLAKEVATLDVVSKGRVLLGIGAGWNEPEMLNHGTDPAHRFKVMRERVEAMKALWTQEEASYEGDTVRFGPVWSYPKPIQKPHPPIIIGGIGPNIIRRVVSYGDGWMPIAFQMPFEALAATIAEMRRLAWEAGRSGPEVTLFGVPTDVDGIAQFAAAGVDRAVWGIPSADAATVLPIIEQYGAAAAAYRAAKGE
ncbi:MAG: LLM class F420-dependent oxidoreductase [Dehalococcoidia bacterium]